MKFEKQSCSLPISNYDLSSATKQFRKHSKLMGNGCKRALIVGRSGCGKTNVMVCLVLHPNGLRFENLYIYSKTLSQPKYDYLKAVIKPMKNINYFEYDDGDQIISPNVAKENSVIIFDDVACCSQSVIRDYFCFGRHRNIDCFYLCQTYTSIPKRLIRDNSNLLVIFRQDNINLKHIYEEHIGNDMTFQQFLELCAQSWNDKYGFVVIDKESDIKEGRYRKGFDCFIQL